MKHMTNPTADQSIPTPLWEFVPVVKYAVPAADAQKAAAVAWVSLQKILRRKDIADTPFKDEQDLHALPQVRLAHLVPPLPWNDAAAALDTALHEWVTAGSAATNVKFVVGQPFSGNAEIVSLLGAQHQAVEVTPPSSDQILSNDLSWLDSWPVPENFWVLSNLEHCYLRHADGLTLLRRLLSLAMNGQLGKGVIGCDSWAWAYIQRVSSMPQADALTLQAFDAERLQSLLNGLMQSRSQTRIHCFDAKNGEEIIGAPSDEEDPRKEFGVLAAHCRGNVAVATTYWRERLRCQPDEDMTADAEKTTLHTGEKDAGEHIWVAGMPPDPELPIGNDEEFFLLLHAILLHGGLLDSLLGDLLPFPMARSRGLLAQLQESGIVHPSSGRWQLQGLAYVAVRSLLKNRDYLTDTF